MFTRIKTVSANGRTYQYLHIVENHRENEKVRQRIIASLGRLDQQSKDGCAQARKVHQATPGLAHQPQELHAAAHVRTGSPNHPVSVEHLDKLQSPPPF